MNVSGTTARNTLLDPGMISIVPGRNEKDVVLSSAFQTDQKRVLYALSIPEYIETWLQPPVGEDLHLVFNPVAREEFHLDFYRGNALQMSVCGACRVVRANQIQYAWKITSPGLATAMETLVDLKLLSVSGGCVVELKHSGFKSALESAWCCKMWDESLTRLRGIMEKN